MTRHPTVPLMMACLGVALTAAASAETRQQHPRPASASAAQSGGGTAMVWQLDGPLNTVYICGSIHVLRRHDQLPAAMLEAYRNSQLVVMELSPEQYIFGILLQSLQPDVFIPMSNRVKRALRQRLLELGVRQVDDLIAGLSAHKVPQLLNSLVLGKAGYSPGYGVEMRILGRCLRDDKPVEGLESAVDQLTQFARRKQYTLEKAILSSIENSRASLASLDRMVELWKSGDLPSLEAEMSEGVTARTRRFVLNERNKLWIPKIMLHARKRENVMIIVGAGHLVGNHSVLHLLSLKGYRFKQL